MTSVNDSLMYQGNCNVPTWGRDSGGNIIGLVGPDGAIRKSVKDALGSSEMNRGTEWTRIWGPNELKTWTKSGEWTSSYPTQDFSVFRREGASMKFDSKYLTTTYGALSNFSVTPTISMAGGVRLGVLVYAHRLNSNCSVVLKLGATSANHKTYTFNTLANQLVEGWNFLQVHTQETGALMSLQTGGSSSNGWQVGAGTFDFESQNVGYAAIQVTGFQGSNYPIVWVEGIYRDGAEALPMITLGFDIQGSSLEVAKDILDSYGFKGYAATPTANGDTSNPQYLWTEADRDRLRMLYDAGWDIVGHSASHNSLGTITDSERISCELQSVRQQLIKLNLLRGADMFASPNGSWSNRSIYELARHGYRWQRNVTNAPIPQADSFCGVINPLNQGAFSCGAATLSTLNGRADLILQTYKANCHFYTHSVEAGGDGTNWPTNTGNIYSYTLDGFCSHLKALQDAGLCRVVTPSEYLDAVASPHPLATYSVPSTASITLAASPVTVANAANVPVVFIVSGGTVSDISVSRDASTYFSTGQTAGMFRVEPGDVMKITYTVAPTVTQMRT